MKTKIKPIRTEADHRWALSEIERLWDKAGTNSSEGEAFEILATLVDSYEREHSPIPRPDPIAAIQFRREQGKLTSQDLHEVFGSSARTSEILNRRRQLSISMIRALHYKHDIPLESLVAKYSTRPAAKAAKAVPKGRRKTC